MDEGVSPRLRLLTFPNAGSSENIYTGMDKTAFGGEAGRRANLLMKWAKANGVEVYAAQPPGRDARLKEAPMESCSAIAQEVFDLVKTVFFGEPAVPWAIFAHSMGTWCAAEFVKLAPRPPTVLVASGFCSPYKPLEDRPWTHVKDLDDAEAFKAECRKWKINEVVFKDGMWKTFEPLLRSDFKAFSDFEPWTGGPRLDCPIKVIYGIDDDRCTKDQVSEWRQVTSSSDFEILDGIDGHHLFPYDEQARYSWFSRVTRAIDGSQPNAMYECIGRKGAACRTGAELTTSLVEPEIQPGWLVEIREEKLNLRGTVRVHVVGYSESPDAPMHAMDAWASKKLFAYKGIAAKPVVVEAVTPPAAPTATADDESVETLTVGRLYHVTGKAGAMLRAGSDLGSRDLELTLAPGTRCYVVQEKPSATGSIRARLVRYSADGSPWRAVDAWCTAKFLSVLGSAPEPLPAVGDTPFLPVFASPTDTAGGVVVLFPGQGAQKIGMADAYLDVPGVTAMFDKASTVFGEDLLALVKSGPVEKLNDTRFSQVCVFLTSLAAMKKVAHDDPSVVAKATACAGFSLGEYTALAFAGVIDLDTALALLKVRSDAMGEACDASDVKTGMLTVVGLDQDKLDAILATYPDCSVANQLFPKGRVLSGPKDQLEKLEAEVKALDIKGSKTIVQPVSGAFHSKYMAPAAAKLQTALEDATFNPPSRLVYSNVTAAPHDQADVEQIKAKMVEQLTAGVLWEDTVRDLNSRFPDTVNFYEPGPGKQLSSMMRRIQPDNMPKMKNV